MGIKNKVRKFKHDLGDPRKRAHAKEVLQARLKETMNHIKRLEKKLKDPKTRAQVRAEIARLKTRYRHLKLEYQKADRKAVRYTQKNPRKALAIAAAVGVLAGTLFSAFKKKK